MQICVNSLNADAAVGVFTLEIIISACYTKIKKILTADYNFGASNTRSTRISEMNCKI